MLFFCHHEWIFFSIISSNWLLLTYRKTIDWYSTTLLNSFLNSLVKSMSVSIDSLGCSLDRQLDQLQIMMIVVSLPILMPPFFFTSYCVSYRPASNICLARGKSTNGGPLTTYQGTIIWSTKRNMKANACYHWETIIVMKESIAIERGRTWQVNLSFLLLSTSAAQIFPVHQSSVWHQRQRNSHHGIWLYLPFVSS